MGEAFLADQLVRNGFLASNQEIGNVNGEEAIGDWGGM